MHRRTPILICRSALGAAVVWMLPLLAGPAAGQAVSPAARTMAVMLRGCSTNRGGAGILAGYTRSTGGILVVTAAHVVGIKGDDVNAVFDGRLGIASPLSCKVLDSQARAPAGGESAEDPPSPDLAVVECRSATLPRHLARDIVDPGGLKYGARLMLIGNMRTALSGDTPCATQEGGWDLPPGDLLFGHLFADAKPPKVEFFNPLQIDLAGASGGPVLTERSQLVGMTIAYGGVVPSVADALPWDYIRNWLIDRGVPESDILLRTESRTAGSLRRNNVEFSVAETNVYVPNFGRLDAAPSFRIDTTLPSFPLIGLSFDFTSTQGTRTTFSNIQGQSLATIDKLTLTIPSITAELQVGSLWSPLRRRNLLGGLYVAGGVASIGVQESVSGLSSRENNIRAWAGIFDAGWRYSFAGRSWGLAASYREGVLFGDAPQQLYPRFRAATAGLFVIFR
jgi:hypothetical protein